MSLLQPTLVVQYAERRDENFATPIKVERSIISETPLVAGEIKQKMAGFRITVDNFPSLSVNDTVLFSLSFLPEKKLSRIQCNKFLSPVPDI